MAQYIHFTDEQKQRAAEVDLEEFLRQRGEKLLPSGRDKRLDRDHSVTIRGCEWFDHDSRQGGNAISFVRWFYNYSYPEAVNALLGGEQGTIYPSAAERQKPPQKPFELPEANTNMRRVFAYLMKQRHIDRDVIAYDLWRFCAWQPNCRSVVQEPRHPHGAVRLCEPEQE